MPRAWVLLLAGCVNTPQDSGVESEPCLPGPAPTLEIGKGELAHVPVNEGGLQSELVHGPQGGYHVNVSLEATHLDASEPWDTELVGTIEGDVVGQSFPYANMRCNQSVPALQTWGLLLIWDAQPEDLHGKHAVVDVRVIDAAGVEVTATTEIEIWDPTLE